MDIDETRHRIGNLRDRGRLTIRRGIVPGRGNPRQMRRAECRTRFATSVVVQRAPER